MCCIDECFDLYPPAWLKREWLANPKSTDLFLKFAGNARHLWPGQTSTHQGFYCMTADGDYLSGNFGRTSRGHAEQLLTSALSRFDQLARRRGWSPKPIPTNRFPLTMGEPVARGGVKLEVAVRDLPRGREQRPGDAQWAREAHNVKWLDLTPQEARFFSATNDQRISIPRQVVWKFAQTTLKDFVRGQASDWKPPDLKDFELYAEPTEQAGGTTTSRLLGFVILRRGNRVYACQLHGRTVFNKRSGRFEEFDLVAAGQRQGATQFNFRQNDLYPAPMGVAYRLYDSNQDS